MNTKNTLANMCNLNNKAEKFDNMVKDRSKDELGLFEGYDEIFNDIQEKILKSKSKKILDIGSETGNLCGELSETLDVTGIDQSLDMIAYAKKKYSNLKLKLGSFLDTPFCKNEFDIVVTTYAFHSLNSSDKKKALNNLIEYLKPDGRIIIVDFMFLNDEEKENIKNNFYNKKRQDLWEVIDSKYYTNVEALESYVKAIGCKIQCKHIVNFTWEVEIQS